MIRLLAVFMAGGFAGFWTAALLIAAGRTFREEG